MRKRLILLALALVAAAGLQTTAAQAASGCYQVECNTCCKTTHGTVCTQRACP
jgi:hypothetical protein